jgi:hypothetical protein
VLGGNAATASSMPEGGATGSGPGEAAPTTRGGTTALGDSDFRDGLGADHHASHQFPGSQIWTYHAGDPLRKIRPAPGSTPAAKPAIVSLKQNWRKMFPLILSPKIRPRRGPGREFQGLIQA